MRTAAASGLARVMYTAASGLAQATHTAAASGLARATHTAAPHARPERPPRTRELPERAKHAATAQARPETLPHSPQLPEQETRSATERHCLRVTATRSAPRRRRRQMRVTRAARAGCPWQRHTVPTQLAPQDPGTRQSPRPGRRATRTAAAGHSCQGDLVSQIAWASSRPAAPAAGPVRRSVAARQNCCQRARSSLTCQTCQNCSASDRGYAEAAAASRHMATCRGATKVGCQPLRSGRGEAAPALRAAEIVSSLSWALDDSHGSVPAAASCWRAGWAHRGEDEADAGRADSRSRCGRRTVCKRLLRMHARRARLAGRRRRTRSSIVQT